MSKKSCEVSPTALRFQEDGTRTIWVASVGFGVHQDALQDYITILGTGKRFLNALE